LRRFLEDFLMTIAYQARNPRLFPGVGYECEYLHPDLGWIPYTAVEGDTEELGRVLYEGCKRGQYGEVLGMAPKPVDAIKADIAARRYTEETKGITINGMLINTERSSQGLILGAALEAFMDPTYSLNWKTPTGFVQLSAPVVLAIAKAIRAHVQACFDREAFLLSRLAAGTYNAEMMNTGWPG
jgi:hypothetical protein